MQTEVVLFDLGGVLVHAVGAGVIQGWIGEESEEAVWRRWLACPWVRRYERGQCTTAQFGQGMVETWGLPMSSEEFLASFRDFPRGLLPGARELVGSLSPGVQCACFSNTNELHWSDQEEGFGLRTMFESHFLSFRMGLVKPDRDAFEHVVEGLGRPAERILFLDDNQINVDGARAVGIDAHRALGVKAARALLDARGLLT
jgi:putative hydrolase of the HAD superfamily